MDSPGVLAYSTTDASVLCNRLVHWSATSEGFLLYDEVHRAFRVCSAVPTAPGTMSASDGVSSRITPVVRKSKVGKMEMEPT